MNQPVDVMIMGHRLTVTSDDGEAHLRQIAAQVDNQMRQLAEGRAPTSVVQLALLTALNIASEYRKLISEREELHRVIDRLSNRVSQLLTTEEGGSIASDKAKHGATAI